MIWQHTEPIRTERLVLRLLVEDDLDDVHAWMSDPAVAEYQLYEPRSREEVAEHIAKAAPRTTLEADEDWVEFGIELDGRIIGCIFFNLKNVADSTAEIGWALTAADQGKGYAQEAAAGVLDLAFGEMGLHRVFADLDPRNTASVRLCERLGMRHEAHHIEHMMFKGSWADTGVYAMLEREWAARA